MSNYADKYYAVARGEKTGLFTCWAEVQPLITGYKGARHRKFSCPLSAQRWIEAHHREIPYGATWCRTRAYEDEDGSWWAYRADGKNWFHAEGERGRTGHDVYWLEDNDVPERYWSRGLTKSLTAIVMAYMNVPREGDEPLYMTPERVGATSTALDFSDSFCPVRKAFRDTLGSAIKSGDLLLRFD